MVRQFKRVVTFGVIFCHLAAVCPVAAYADDLSFDSGSFSSGMDLGGPSQSFDFGGADIGVDPLLTTDSQGFVDSGTWDSGSGGGDPQKDDAGSDPYSGNESGTGYVDNGTWDTPTDTTGMGSNGG